MNAYVNISRELKLSFGKHPVFKILLPLDVVFLLGGFAIMVLSSILGISLGSFIESLAYWAFILGLLLAYANFNQTYLYTGLLGYGVIKLLYVIINLIFVKYRFLSWSSLFAAIIFGGLGYLALKHSMEPDTTKMNINR